MRSDGMKVSIVIPVYNGSDYLSVAIDSALSQTYKNIEIVVVNDGSTDGGVTEKIAQSYGEKIKYVHQPNAGVAGALNTALEVMTGDFFTWLSHDDIHHHNKVERNISFFQSLEDPEAIIFSYYTLINEEGNKVQDVTFDLDALHRAPSRVLLNGCINGCTLFIPAHIMRKFGPFDLSKKYTQDYYLWDKILQEHDFYCQPEFLVSYRIHANQDTQKKSEAVNAEAEPLWKYMIDARSPLDRVFMEGSAFRYFDHLRNHLRHSPYKLAIEHTARRSQEVLDHTLISVVVIWRDEESERSFRSILNQSYPNLEIIVVIPEGAAIPPSVKFDRRVRIFRPIERSKRSRYDLILQQCRGEYVVFSGEGAVLAENRIERQHRFMQLGGLKASMCSFLRGGAYTDAADICELKSASVVALERTVVDAYMFHKVCWYEGGSFTDDAHVPFELQLVALLETATDIIPLSEPLVTL